MNAGFWPRLRDACRLPALAPPAANRLFRSAGVAAALWPSLPALVGLLAAGPRGLANPPGSAPEPGTRLVFWLLVGVVPSFSLTVAAVFWWLTAAPRPRRRMGLRLSAVILQSLIGLVGDANLLTVVAAELPFVLTHRVARRCLMAQISAFATLAILVHTILETSTPTKITTVVLVFSGWQVAAFLLGTLAVREAAQRHDLAGLNSELGATRELLAEGSRLSERVHLSRELHDGLGHRLAALSVHLDLAARTAQGGAADAVREAHAEARRLYQEVRDVVSALRHEAGVDVRQALNVLASGFSDLKIDLALPAELPLDDLRRAEALFHCVSTAIDHARRACATRLSLAAAATQGGLEVEIQDDGPRWDAAGLDEERFELERRFFDVGGRVALAALAPAGLSLTLRLPASEPGR